MERGLRCERCHASATHVVHAVDLAQDGWEGESWAWLACKHHADRAEDLDNDESHTLLDWALGLVVGRDPEYLRSTSLADDVIELAKRRAAELEL